MNTINPIKRVPLANVAGMDSSLGMWESGIWLFACRELQLN